MKRKLSAIIKIIFVVVVVWLAMIVFTHVPELKLYDERSSHRHHDDVIDDVGTDRHHYVENDAHDAVGDNQLPLPPVGLLADKPRAGAEGFAHGWNFNAFMHHRTVTEPAPAKPHWMVGGVDNGGRMIKVDKEGLILPRWNMDYEISLDTEGLGKSSSLNGDLCRLPSGYLTKNSRLRFN